MVTGQNTILFLFNQNDIIEKENNKLTFLFGEVNNSPIANCKPPKKIDYDTNHIEYNCACAPIDYESNHVVIKCETKLICPDVFWKESEDGNASFNLDCNDEDSLWKESEDGNASFHINCECVEEEDNTGTTIYFENVRQYFGKYSIVAFSIDLSNINFYSGFHSSFRIIAADMRFSEIYHFGFDSSTSITIIRRFDASYYMGYSSSSNILYDQYNPIFRNPEDHFSLVIGNTLYNNIVFDPYHEFFEVKTDYAESRFGFEQKNPHFVYDPYHEFFEDQTDSAKYYNGFNVLNPHFVYDPYNEFFTLGESGVFGFGFEQQNTQFVFDPYNELGPQNPNYFGFDANGSIRYSDDPYFDDKAPLELPVGFYSEVEFKFANIYYPIVSNAYFGISSQYTLQPSVGFIANSYFGYANYLRYMTIGQQYAVFNSCYAAFGFELHDNQQKTRYMDLSANQCCTKIPYQLKHVEMTDVDGWDVRYGLDKGWGFSMLVEFSTLPRFSSNVPVGFSSEVIDNSVYLGDVRSHFGLYINTRGMYCESNMHMSYGNFIIDQNEIKVEITKPLDTAEINYSMYLGSLAHVSFGVPYMLSPNDLDSTVIYSLFDLRTEEALRGRFYFGFRAHGTLNVRPVLRPGYWYSGFSSRTVFYEPPIYIYSGFAVECEALITENWVEFLEEGELENDYIIQNENGDPDLDRPQGESIEGYAYQRYIKGRCY